MRPSSKKRKAGDLSDVGSQIQGSSSPLSRPGTSSTLITPDRRPFHTTVESSPAPQHITPQSRLSNSRSDTHSGGARKLSVVRNGETSSPHDRSGEEARRESISSRSSWIRRLSTIPNSQTDSPRSSVGPDSPSVVYSHGSAVPILLDPSSSPAQLPPNKLVKRTSSTRVINGSMSRTGSSQHLPTLRRPATSHQRSVTLHQQFREEFVDPTNEGSPIPLIDEETSDPPYRFNTSESRPAWRPFFESRPTRFTKERSSGRSGDGGLKNFYSTSRRVLPDESVKPTLLKPHLISWSDVSYTAYFDEYILPLGDGLDNDADPVQITPDPSTDQPEDHKRIRRPLSMHFSSPSAWMTRSGSLRGKKKNPERRTGGKRYSSAPVPTMAGRNTAPIHGLAQNGHRTITDPLVFRPQTENDSAGNHFSSSFQARSRNSSSPLPPLSRLSSFNLDLARLGLSSSSSSTRGRSPHSPVIHNHAIPASKMSPPGLVSPISPSSFGAGNTRMLRTSDMADRASTLVGSDTDGRAFTLGDDDDMDFQSETVFDSLRSGATGSIRSPSTPLDSMFDESPPSLNGKIKRLSIHEFLGNGLLQEGSSRIVEEDEGMSTPVKGTRSSQELDLQTPVPPRTRESDIDFSSSPPSFSLATKDFGRLSLDDEEDDEDWTRDDENLEHNNQLSPPSSSLNSRRVSPSFRAALADLTHSGSVNGGSTIPAERSKSNLFDWSEPSSAEKLDHMGHSPRPKTAHAKHVADGRGGRAIGRRGPTALHIRSQSVPVVPDVAGQREYSNLVPKFGTWGLGGKGVSEEWDGDFEFEAVGEDGPDDGDNEMEHSGMFVPPAIQASQENVVGHVGQIREVCLLVEDLKRLRSLAREKDILNGTSARLWKEAEGIIALAVPDEEDLTLSLPHSPSSIIQISESAKDKYLDYEQDAKDIPKSEAPFEVLDRYGRPAGYVYDGNTVRRRSVFSPDDDIFGSGIVVNNSPSRDQLRPPANSSLLLPSSKTSSEYARTVMETMHQHRSTSDPLLHDITTQATNKMPFDTTSLRDLVHRASVLSRTLSDLIRKAEGSPSPEAFPPPDSSPAFTRVFTDPSASPAKHLPRSQSNNSVLSGSIDTSPSRGLGQRMHMMTVV